MAVTKIRKISSTSLLVLAVLTIIVTVAFFVGGYIDPTAAKPEPRYTDALFYLMYFAFAVTLLAMVLFAIVGFARNLKDAKRRKNSLTALVGVLAIVALLVITYFVGGTDLLNLSKDFQQYNTDHYLKFADMWLLSIYVMLGLNIIALVVFAITGSLKKK
ncbi:MAG: hypothetical protein Q4E10_02875 [Porphyromonas sp.]|nr:hypothetical protein [Porphyromonas sp.]